jgi:carbonic anhydrase
MIATIDLKDRLVDGNARFRESVDHGFLTKLSKGQQPFMAILSCSDSRVVPERIFNLNLGDAFVVRVAGNSVADPGALGSLEYAVEHLHVKAIVVLGHTGCGAVQAVIAPQGREPEGLRLILRDIERARYVLPTDQQSNSDRMVESNVKLQVKSIEETPVLGRAIREGSLRLYGAVYELQTGNLRFV